MCTVIVAALVGRK